MSNLEADWGEVKVYKQITIKLQNIFIPFNYSFRSSRASFYESDDKPQYIIKRLNFKKPEFKKHIKAIKDLVNKNKMFAELRLHNFGPHEAAPYLLYEKINGIDFSALNKEEKLKSMSLIKAELIKLYDGGFYFKDIDNFNIVKVSDDIRIIGWDSIVPIEDNQTFLSCYPWAWVV